MKNYRVFDNLVHNEKKKNLPKYEYYSGNLKSVEFP